MVKQVNKNTITNTSVKNGKTSQHKHINKYYKNNCIQNTQTAIIKQWCLHL